MGGYTAIVGMVNGMIKELGIPRFEKQPCRDAKACRSDERRVGTDQRTSIKRIIKTIYGWQTDHILRTVRFGQIHYHQFPAETESEPAFFHLGFTSRAHVVRKKTEWNIISLHRMNCTRILAGDFLECNFEVYTDKYYGAH